VKVERLLLAFGLLVPLLAGCGGPPARDSSSSATASEASVIVSRKCTRCHAAPERGKHTRAELDTALGPHRARVKLTEDQWESIEAFLAGGADERPAFR
jgi:hypothetical protein